MSGHPIAFDIVRRIAFALAHSIWQGALIALVTTVGVRFLPAARRSPELRYSVFLAALLSMPMLALATFWFCDEIMVEIPDYIPAASFQFVEWARWMVMLWFSGVAICSSRLSVAWLLSRRLLRQARLKAPPNVEEVFEQIKARLGVCRHVRLLLSRRTDTPIVIGWIQPAILLPFSAITGLDPEQLKAVLAHELAHIRRHDFVVNLLQRCVESLMFYHPAVWWLSSRVRAEREHCCDDLAVQVCGNRLIYAHALVDLEQARAVSSVAVAANGNDLTQRIRRILGRDTSSPDWQSAAAASLFAAAWLVGGVWQSGVMIAQTKLPPAPRIAPAESVHPLLQMAIMTLTGAPSLQQAGTVQGVVVKLGSGEFLPGTRVGLMKVDGGTTPYSVTTTAEGKFTIPNIEPGEYRLLATRTDGFLPSEYGQTKPGARGLPITLKSGQSLQNVQIAMAAPGAISGRILDENGDPVGHAQVQALRSYYSDGQRALTIVQSVQTNDLGEYRLFWLPPGEYNVTAREQNLNAASVAAYIRPPEEAGYHGEQSPPVVSRRTQENGEVVDVVFAPVYFPGTIDVRAASVISVRSDDNLRNMNIRLPEPPMAHRVRGTVIDGVTSQLVPGATVWAMPRNAGPNVTVPTAVTDQKGAFDVSGIVSGSYTLFANLGGSRPTSSRSGRVPIEIGTVDLQNLAVVVPGAFDIPGKFTVDGASDLSVSLLLVEFHNGYERVGSVAQPPRRGANSPNPNAPSPDGSFLLASVTGDDYQIGVFYPGAPNTGSIFTLPPNVYVKSIRMGTQDVLNDGLHLDGPPQKPLEIVIGTNPGTVNGTVVDGKLAAIPNGIVALIPERADAPDAPEALKKSRHDLYRSAVTDSSGHFNLTGIPPGDYKLFAWEEVENGAWLDPDFIRQVDVLGTRIVVHEGSKDSIQLTAIGSRR